MPLIKCPDCGNEISSTTYKCPNCGYYHRPSIYQKVLMNEKIKNGVILKFSNQKNNNNGTADVNYRVELPTSQMLFYKEKKDEYVFDKYPSNCVGDGSIKYFLCDCNDRGMLIKLQLLDRGGWFYNWRTYDTISLKIDDKYMVKGSVVEINISFKLDRRLRIKGYSIYINGNLMKK